MDKSKIKVIAMDLDGTLTQHKQHLSPEARATLVALGRKYKLLMVGAGQVQRIFNQMEKFPVDIIGNYGLQYATYNPETKDLDIRRDLSYMTYAPILFISALTGQRVDRLFELINYVNDQSAMRITTGMLNTILADATARVQPPTDKGRRLKIYYMTQTGIRPPHFVCFCNDARLFHFSYQRYLENQIREVFGLQGTPVRITIRQKGDKEDG